MSKQAPERIWVDADDLPETFDAFDCPVRHVGGVAQYHVATDLSQALVAAKLHEAAEACEGVAYSGKYPGLEDVRELECLRCRDAVLALIDTDHQAALDAVRAEERERCAAICRDLAPRIEWDSTQDDRMHESILERAARHILTKEEG